ncbi:MAG: RNA-binding S4 domain-containing protein [Magnetospirillum sp.]|nr:RNA-binding S4 domain-containing protein [Magnetospirillum sp.]
MRIDKWLFFTRFIKSRSRAALLVEAGEVRVNGKVVIKPAQAVNVGDVLVFPIGKRWRQVEVLALGTRRGTAPEAQALYREMESPPTPDDDVL